MRDPECPACGLADHVLLAHIDGELPPGRRADVAARIAACAVCRGRVAAFGATARVLRAATPPRDDPIGRAMTRARVAAAAERGAAGWSRWRWARHPALAAAALPLVLLILLATGDRLDLDWARSCAGCDAGPTDPDSPADSVRDEASRTDFGDARSIVAPRVTDQRRWRTEQDARMTRARAADRSARAQPVAAAACRAGAAGCGGAEVAFAQVAALGVRTSAYAAVGCPVPGTRPVGLDRGGVVCR